LREYLIPQVSPRLINDRDCHSVFQRFERMRLMLDEGKTYPLTDKFRQRTALDNLISPGGARRVIVRALETLSPQIGNLADSFFESGRVFTATTISPDRGINCVGVPGKGPFISVPMRECSATLLTRLAHEVGHAIQKTLAKDCSYFCHGIERLLSESIASFFEMWTLNFILDGRAGISLSSDDRLGLLAPLFEDIFERTAYALYEERVLLLSEAGDISAKELSLAWRSVNEDLYSGLYILPNEYDAWWAAQAMMFRYPLAQGCYSAAAVVGLSLASGPNKSQENLCGCLRTA